jgi:hypothetical protein
MAEAAGITLVAIARADGFEVFTHPGRIRFVSCSRLPEEALPTDILRKGTRS